MGNIERYNASLTPEERVASSLKAVAARRANAAQRKEEREKYLTLREYSQEYLAKHGREIVGGIGDIARHSTSEQNRVKAAALLVTMSTIKPEADGRKDFNSLNLKELSDAELERLIAEGDGPEEYELIEEPEAVAVVCASSIVDE